jgi:hypothetical protein
MIQDRPSWVNRPAIVAGVAFLIGAIVAGVVVAFILTRGDDNGPRANGNVTPATSTTPVGTSEATVVGATTPSVTGTPLNPRKPDDALAAYVQDQMRQRYIGPCPSTQAGQTPQGICSIELYRSDELLTVTIGPPFSEVVGEVVLTPGENGVWSAAFVARTDKPPAMGAVAIVYGAGDCLNFHAAPSKASDSLSCQQDGNRAAVIGGPQVADNITWWQLKDLGWASAEFLEGAP